MIGMTGMPGIRSLLRLNRMLVTALLVVTSSLIQKSTQTTHFDVQPGNVTLSVNNMLNVTFTCNVSDGSPPDWVLKFPDIMQNLSTRDSDDMVVLHQRGVMYNSTSITIPRVEQNNCTMIRCAVVRFTGSSITEFSEPYKLLLAGPPLAPEPVLSTPCPSQLEIQWEIPYSHDSFSVENYTITIVNTTSRDVLVEAQSETNQSYVFVLDGETQAFSCHLLEVSVIAVSSIGASMPGVVTGGFPIAPQPFQSEVEVSLTFQRDGSPIVDVTFEAPLICDFQTSTYTITISTRGLPDVTRQSTYSGGSRDIEETFDSQLQPNKNYTITVSIEDERFEGQVSTSMTISTSFEPLPVEPESQPEPKVNTSGLSIAEIGGYAGAAGGGLVVILMVLTLLIVTIICTRKSRQHNSAPGATMDRILNNNNNRTDGSAPFTVQPIGRDNSGHGSLYETINDYQIHAAANKNRPPSHEQQCADQHHWKLQQMELAAGRAEKDDLEDSTYQIMNSASGDATSSSVCSPSHRYPVVNPKSGERSQSNPLSTSLSSYHDATEQSQLTPDNSLPHSYPFRACPPLTTIASSCLSPIHESSHKKADPNFQCYTVNQPFGVTVLPPNFDQIQGGGGEGGSERDEGDQEYTFMSQAGTLTGMKSRTPSCTVLNGGSNGNGDAIGQSRISEC